jgi:tetratricopeptide (TPR) repeat protein
MPAPQRRSVPAQTEGRFSKFWRELRWSFGLIYPSDLAPRSDVELINLAEDFVRRGKPKRAALVLGAFGQRTTLDPRVLQRYGDVSRAVGAHEGAILSYLQAAEMYVQQGVYAKASALLSQLVRTYPDNIDARVALARAFEGMDRKKDAAANYAAAVQILEAIGQGAAAGPFVARIAQLWPMARADYAEMAALPPPSVPPGVFSNPPGLPDVVVSPTEPNEPASVAPPIIAGRKISDLTGPLELDLGSYVGEMPAQVEHPTTELAPEALDDLVASSQLQSESDIQAARPVVNHDPSYGEFPTASYEAIDGAKTLMDLRAVTVPADGKSILIDLRDMPSTKLRIEGADTSPDSGDFPKQKR